jgi:hypothetical protein
MKPQLPLGVMAATALIIPDAHTDAIHKYCSAAL